MTQDEAVARALETSHRLAEANARVTGAQAAIRSRQAAEQPTVVLSGGYTRTNHVDEFAVPGPTGLFRVIYPDVPDNYFTRIAMQWPIYTAGRTDALIRAAEAEARAASERMSGPPARISASKRCASYWALVTAIEAERVLQEAVTRADATVRDVRARFDNGLIPPNEVSSAEAQRSRQQLQLIEAQNQRRSVLEDLRRLTGVTGVIEPSERLTPFSAPSTATGGVAASRESIDRNDRRWSNGSPPPTNG